MRTDGGKQRRATHAGIMPYVPFVRMLAASLLDHNPFFILFDIVEECLTHVDDDCRPAAQTFTQDMAHPTKKDGSTVLYLDPSDTMRHLVAAPLKAPPLTKSPVPSLGGLRISQMADDRRMAVRARQVLETPQKGLKNSRRGHQQPTHVQAVHGLGHVAFNQTTCTCCRKGSKGFAKHRCTCSMTAFVDHTLT